MFVLAVPERQRRPDSLIPEYHHAITLTDSKSIDDTVRTYRQVVNFKGSWETHTAQVYRDHRGPYLTILSKHKILPGLQTDKTISWKSSLARRLRVGSSSTSLTTTIPSFCSWGMKALQAWPQRRHGSMASMNRPNKFRGWAASTEPICIPTALDRRQAQLCWFIPYLGGRYSPKND